MALVRRMCLLALFLCSILLNAQEVKFIDLSVVSQRTQLRHPPAPPCGAGVCAGYAGSAIGDGAPDFRDPHAMGVYLLRISPAELTALEPFEAEFRVLNTGLAPIELPVSPHLSDLQPADESRAFDYFSLSLVLSVKGDSRHPVLAIAELYGASDHEGTMFTLRPGEWIRVRAKLTPQYSPEESGTINLLGGFWLRRPTFTPHPGGDSTSMMNLYPNVTPTPPVAVRIVVPKP
jgi:hypothetical protein